MVMGWHPADRLGHTQRRPPEERTSAIASPEATMRTPSRLVAGDCQDAKLSTYPAGGAGQLGGHDGQRRLSPLLSTAAHVSPVEREVACGVAYRSSAAAELVSQVDYLDGCGTLQFLTFRLIPA